MIRGMRLSRLTLPAMLIGFCFFFVAPAPAGDWARWLGPNQDGTTMGNDLFPGESFGLDVAWNRPLGIAYSGIAIADGRAVTMFADGELDWLTAVKTTTGEELWRYKIDTMYAGHDGSEGGPISMPVVDDGVVFGLGPKGHLFAVDLEDGDGSGRCESTRSLVPVHRSTASRRRPSSLATSCSCRAVETKAAP